MIMLCNNLHLRNLCFLCLFIVLFATKNVNAQSDKNYNGFRLQVYNIQVQKEHKQYYQIRFNAANTGRKPLDISASRPMPFLLLDFDHSLYKNKLGAYKENIRRVLTVTDINLPVGKIAKHIEIRFPKMLPEDTITNPNPIVISEEEMNQRKDSRAVVVSKEEKNPIFINKKADCYDFEFDTVKIVSVDSRWLTLEYTLVNNGNSTAPLLGTTNDEKDNLTIRAYISGAPRMSKGALLFGGIFIENRNKEEGIIPPGKRFKGTFKIDIREKSRYMNYLILALDPFQLYYECDERNNNFVVDLSDI